MSSVSTALVLTEMRISLAKQQLETTKQQGKAAITLIEASAALPPPNAAPGVGEKLNVVG
ncbi:MAG TPA: hypothetical protein VNG33_07905 [Polyangiaceae bacterium]|nr:hypothetical protein [Polyangiaceae bacterium]